MKKLIVSALAGAVLLSSGIAGHDAEAAKLKIKYTDKTKVKDIKAGKISLDGLKFGKSIEYYAASEKYDRDDYKVWRKNSYDCAFADNVEVFDDSAAKINRIVDARIDLDASITRTKMRSLYKKPDIGTIYNDDDYFDIYKNVTFVYISDSSDNNAYLSAAIFRPYKGKEDMRKWKHYIKNVIQANPYSVDNNEIELTNWNEY